MPNSYWAAIGYLCIDDFAVRIDMFERIFFIARQRIKKGPFLESSDLMNPIGCNSKQLSNLLLFCGFDNIMFENEQRLYFIKEKKVASKKLIHKKIKTIKILKNNMNKKNNSKNKTNTIKKDLNSPFAILQKLL